MDLQLLTKWEAFRKRTSLLIMSPTDQQKKIHIRDTQQLQLLEQQKSRKYDEKWKHSAQVLLEFTNLIKELNHEPSGDFVHSFHRYGDCAFLNEMLLQLDVWKESSNSRGRISGQHWEIRIADIESMIFIGKFGLKTRVRINFVWSCTINWCFI